MKKERLLNAIGQIDEKLIADAFEDKAIASAKKQIRVRQKRFLRRIAAVAACVLLALCAGVAVPFAVGNAEAGRMTIEINPGVEYLITRNGKVKSVRFLNDDAKYSLEEVELKGQGLKTAVALTIAAYKAVGYMDGNDTVLISFDKKLSENAGLKETVAEDVRRTLEKSKSVHTVVYAVETDDAETAALAEKYGISQGKAKLVGDAAKNSDLPVEDIVNLPLDELVGLQKEVSSVVVDSDYIGILSAKETALKDVGLSTRVDFTEARLIGGGTDNPHYRLVFNDKHTQWTYLINAVNGDILEKNEVALFISLEEAKAIALKHSGIDNQGGAIKVVFTREELSRNQGRQCWVLEFYTAEFQYVYKIDAKTCEIILADYHIDIRKAKEIALTDAGMYTDVGRITFTVEEYAGGGIKTPYFYFVFNDATTQRTYRIDAISGGILEKSESTLFIPLQRAREIALNDAGIASAGEATFTKEELNRSAEDLSCWILEFYTEERQFVYKIDAKSGEAVFIGKYLYIGKAREIAMRDSGVMSDGKIVLTTEELVETEVGTPYFCFVFNDGQTQWTYRIDATNGKILYKTQDSPQDFRT
ncbi:MAG: PepSY domain-containing protein [Candidatus Borkfalkiaceae bacterium]|nr:PepSY domain-containing protein [Christensenellaceae bacterium]